MRSKKTSRFSLLYGLAAFWLCLLTTGCTGGNFFNIKNLAKSDVDMITDTHIQELRSLTRRLLVKLYKRNPIQLTRGHSDSIDHRISQLFNRSPLYHFAELDGRQGNDAVRLAFADDFNGDRVFALMVGVTSMLHASYNMKTELFMLDDLNQQKLYASARNLEIINWRLNSLRNADNQPYLLSNGYLNGVANLSFERLFGKMIVLQDMMAKIVADKNNRTLNSVVHSVASTTLLPI